MKNETSDKVVVSEQVHRIKLRMTPKEFAKRLGLKYNGRIQRIEWNSTYGSEDDEFSVDFTILEVDRLKQIEYNKEVVDR